MTPSWSQAQTPKTVNCPDSLLYRPELHEVHVVAASAALAYVPGWQSVHVEAPVVLLADPGGQAKQVVAGNSA